MQLETSCIRQLQNAKFLLVFCSSEDQMMIGARFVFVNFWCKQKLFGKGIVVFVKTYRRLIIC